MEFNIECPIHLQTGTITSGHTQQGLGDSILVERERDMALELKQNYATMCLLRWEAIKCQVGPHGTTLV